MSTTFQIITEGRVYVFSRRELKFEATMEIAQNLLRGKSKASTFDVLFKGIAEKWLLREDVVKPFGDRRQNLRFVCTFNLDEDILCYSDESGHIKHPLARLREPEFVPLQRSEFTPFDIAAPPQLDLTDFPPPYQKPSTPIPKNRLAFCHVFFWTSRINGATYSDPVTQNLHFGNSRKPSLVEEVFTKQHIFFRSFYVTVLDVPSWESCESHLFDIGGTTIVLHQSLRTALEIARDEAKKDIEAINSRNRIPRTYLLLSVRHMLVCHVNSAGKFSYTAPMTFMDGLTPPSPSAINLLLQALSPSRPLPRTLIHELPLEIQDRILEYVSEGSVEAARIGCILGVGLRLHGRELLIRQGEVAPLNFSPLPLIAQNIRLLSRSFALGMYLVGCLIDDRGPDAFDGSRYKLTQTLFTTHT